MVTALILLAVFLAATVLVVLVVATSHEEAGRPSLPDVARAARNPAHLPAAGALDLRVDGLGFPDWNARAWQVVGGRRDRLEDRRLAGTVVYRRREETITYTILSGERGVETLPPDGRVQVVDPGPDSLLALTGERDGRTVVMTGAPASDEMARTMRRLAARSF